MARPVILVNSGSAGPDLESPTDQMVEIPEPQPDLKRKGKDYDALEDLLFECYYPQENKEEKFWPYKLLKRILTKERIIEELADYENNDPEMFTTRSKESYADEILGYGGTGNCYLRIFAGLALIGKGAQIGRFLEEKVCDEDLPLVKCTSNAYSASKLMLARKTSPEVRLECLSIPRVWGAHDRDHFQIRQQSLDVVYLSLNPDKSVRHEVFGSKVIMPWTSRTRMGQGGYGTVYRVTVPRECHNFDGALQAIKIHDTFAIKELIRRRSDLGKEERDFWKEVEMLKRFSGAFHDHLVTLLMSWTIQGQHYLLFPWAGCDLDKYWTHHVNQVHIDPSTHAMEMGDVQWISAQVLGLTAALNLIHNPTHLHLRPEERKYGRHGDIKPENILYYPSPKYSKGILVISDFGLCAFNSDKSRSNVPGEAIPQTPGYRPPECDLKGGTISRSYDIWTFGCLLLEMVCWALGGKTLREQFSDDRFSVYISGVQLNIFFDLQKKKEGDKYVIKVKDAVKEYFIKLHAMPSCTQYFHDLLDIIEDQMIIVLTPDKERIRSGALLTRMEELHSQIINGKSYGLEPCPQIRQRKQDVAFEAELNNTAKGMVRVHEGVGLKVHEGEVRKSKAPDELQAMEHAM